MNRGSTRRCAAIVAPTNKHLEELHFPELKNALEEIGLYEDVHYEFNKTKHLLTFNKATCGFEYRLFFVSAENFKNVVGWEWDFALWDEPGFASEELKRFVDQRTGRARGAAKGQILYIGVVQLVNWYYELFGANSMLETTAT